MPATHTPGDAPRTGPAPAPDQAHRKALDRLLSLQEPSGCWEGEMVWNTMILSQYVIVCRLVGRDLPEPTRAAMTRHYRGTAAPEGGWGLHPEAGPSLYCTTLAHIALRLLGNHREDPLCARSAAWLRARPGGVQAVPTWGKLWLAFTGLHDYRAVNPLPPELFLLPRRLPIHPDRLYCHTRTIYQAMAYLYGIRFSGDLGHPLTKELRDDLLFGEQQPVAQRPFRTQRHLLGTDAVVPPGRGLRAAFDALALYERRPPRRTRARALARCLERVTHEQDITRNLGISPVSSLLNVLVLYASGAHPAAVDRALTALDHWRWADPERGIRYAGARSQTWDTAFAVEALLAHRPTRPGTQEATILRACAYLREAQVTEDVPRPEVTARAPAAGGWCFSDSGHRWPVSDCTAEAATALLQARALLPDAPVPVPVPDEQRLQQATAFLLHRQNRDGGFGSYEPRRGSRLLEAANPSEMFSHCMIEDSYTECTGSALAALAELGRWEGQAHREAVTRAIRQGARFLLRTQRRDGSWRAAWGVNRIYGTLFAVRGLRAAGAPPGHPRLARAAHWLQSVQRADGGWGEHHRGCTEDRYVEHPESQPVMTAWALLALLPITDPGTKCVHRGIDWLCEHQAADGSWHQEAVTGVFFGTAMLDYRHYAEYFPLWALGGYLTALGQAG